MLWLFKKSEPIDYNEIKDLKNNSLLKIQHKFYGIWIGVTNLSVFAVLGWITQDYFGAFVFGFLIRTFITHHFTWFINSLAHYWGSRSYTREISAVDNYVIALLTFGEGYHNYHHVFASDYRNGIRWYHYDPTKWLIWGLSKLGLASTLRTFNSFSVKRRLVEEDKKLMLEKLKNKISNQKETIELHVNQLYERITKRISESNNKRLEFINAKKEKIAKWKLKRIKLEFKQQKRGFYEDWRGWNRLVKNVLE